MYLKKGKFYNIHARCLQQTYKPANDTENSDEVSSVMLCTTLIQKAKGEWIKTGASMKTLKSGLAQKSLFSSRDCLAY